VRAAVGGETVFAPAGGRTAGVVAAGAGVEAPTARELEVLAGWPRGLTNAEIGPELFIGEATVKTHLLRVSAKLGVNDRIRAVTVAVAYGLLPGQAPDARPSSPALLAPCPRSNACEAGGERAMCGPYSGLP
jgi:DNA-binding CsgD family transcriptional regulator